AVIATAVETNPGAREAQKRLAEEVTKMVNGDAALEQAIKISTALVSGDVKQLTKDEIEQGFKDVSTYELEKKDVKLVDLLEDTFIVIRRGRRKYFLVYFK